ncbi:MAG: twin-arginine translocase subunit TatC, partial [Planctomycetia bacterium]|nr:twin-arginine translocase subunit TatC [Planctomycetia bacterium]
MSRINEDDYFQDSTMSFGEHLDELRTCLIRAIAGLVVGFIVGLFIGGHVVEMVQSPLKNALTSYYQGRSERAIIDRQEEFYQRGYGEDIMALPTQYGVVAEKYLVNPDELGKALGIEVKDISADLANPCNYVGDGAEVTSEEVLQRSKEWKVADYFNVEKWAQWCSDSWKEKGIDLTEDVSATVLEQKQAEAEEAGSAEEGKTAKTAGNTEKSEVAETATHVEAATQV